MRSVMVAMTVALLASAAPAQEALRWTPLKQDGIHDPRSPAVRLLQQPAEGLSELAVKAPDPYIGNQVRWVKAIEDGVIVPRSNITPEAKMRLLDQDIYLNIGGSQAVVRFPHKAHTYWLDCNNCHEEPFKSEAGATRFSMYQILEGEFCGRCHGAVAFPLTECARCHSVPQVEYREIEKRLGLKRSESGRVARRVNEASR